MISSWAGLTASQILTLGLLVIFFTRMEAWGFKVDVFLKYLRPVFPVARN